jgi:tetratricopeptide (TPR) repeat protein
VLTLLVGHPTVHLLAWSQDSKRLASGDPDGVKVWDAGTHRVLLNLHRHVNMLQSVSWSPDGRRLASVGDQAVKVWDAATGEELLHFPAGLLGGGVAWSQDGRRLAAPAEQAGAVKVWDASPGYALPDLSPTPTPPSARRADADLRGNFARALLRLGRFQDAVQAYEAALNLFEQVPEEFPGDVTHLQARAELLRELGDAHKARGRRADAQTAYRRALTLFEEVWVAESTGRRSLPRYLLETSDRLIALLVEDGQFAPAIAERRRLLQRFPDSAELLNNQAWSLATSPDPSLRDPGEALDLAKRATTLVRLDGTYLNTLGVAHYRNRAWKDALEPLFLSVALRKGGNSFDFFFLAMAHWQLGEKDRARNWYARAVAWMEKHKPKDKELLYVRAEAEALIGAPKPPGGSSKEADAADNLRIVMMEVIRRAEPKAAVERVAFAQLCQEVGKRYAAASRFYAEAFADPSGQGLIPLRGAQVNVTLWYRSKATRAAALAGCGQGEDAAGLGEMQRLRWRQQALTWLRADLRACEQHLDREPMEARPKVTEKMRQWLAEPDFNGVRGAEALARLPEAERAAWARLWADVADLLARTKEPPPRAKEKPDKP